MTQAQIPVTVFSGFLGSGKTTIITHVIDELQQQGIQVVYIKNEIGSENIDSTLMQGKHIQTKELLNGCICCTLVGPFIQAIDEIALTLHPDRIIIEASGAADPAAIALMIDSQPRLTRDGVLCVIDVSNFEGYSDLSQTAKNQTRFTDLLVFNKVELVDLERKRAVVGYVRELNDHAPVVEAPGGVLPAAVACGISTTELTKLLKNVTLEEQDPDHHHDHLEVDGITSFHVSLTQAMDLTKLQKVLEQTPHSVYRIKGIVHSADGQLHLVNKVGNRISLLPAPDDFKVTTESIVCIGFTITEYQADITHAITSCYVSLSK
jgi:G3E family GTPase